MYTGSTRMNLANTLSKLGRNEEALGIMRSALAVMPVGEDDNTRANILTNLGRLHAVAGDPDSATFLLRQGLALATTTQARTVQANAHKFLSGFFEERGRLDSALHHHKQWAALNDSIFNEESSAQIAEMQEKYESGKKDVLLAENKAQLEQRSLTIKAVAIGAALLLLASLFAFRAYRIKKRTSEQLARKNAVIDEQLKEKELLLREIHHRVKNNLQTVSSLLSIQGRGIADPTAKQAVNDSRLRVKSMALIHQDLYRDGDLTGVEMKAYVDKLATSLISSYGRADSVVLQSEVQELRLDVDTAVPIGLILNELITNALKYAWPGGGSGNLAIAMRITDQNALLLRVHDDGIGYDPGATRSADSTGFGLGMIQTFASKLKAEWSIRTENGTVVEMIVRNFKLAR
jgi:two-component sensor histidine kinase